MDDVKIFIGNVNYAIRELDLWEIFSHYGMVLKVELNTPRGHAFITMADRDSAQLAINALHRSIVGGRKVTVNFAQVNARLKRDDVFFIRPMSN